MNAIDTLIDNFKKFPGIGPRQAKRFVYFLLNQGNGFRTSLAHNISVLKDQVSLCQQCFRHFLQTKNKTDTCSICADGHRDATKLMIVSTDVDLEVVEKSGAFNGFYFVIGGTIPVLEKEPAERARLKELVKKVSEDVRITEIIIAENATPEGEHTARFIEKAIDPFVKERSISVTVLGRGLSSGLELEYSDNDTLKHALKNRTHLT